MSQRNKWKWAGSIAVLGLGMWIGGAITTDASSPTQPGSPDDPLVTKSYVDKLLAGGSGGSVSADKAIQELQAELEKAKQELKKIVDQAGGIGGGTAPAAGLKVEVLKPGMKLFGGEGATVIVRNGDVRAISTDGNGIPDVTAGEDIQDGQTVGLNHMLLFPRDGTRGITPGPQQKDDVYVIVQGPYVIIP